MIFLRLPQFEHDFDQVEQVIHENDDVYKIPGLHNIRTKVEPAKSRWTDVLPSELGRQFPGKELWQK